MTSYKAYRGKRVLVTGLSGFKGRWLGKWLSHLGAEVIGFGLEPVADPFGGKPELETEFSYCDLDINDQQRVLRYVEEMQPDAIFHLAAQALVRPSYQSPIETFSTNVLGVVHVLEAARLNECVKAVVNVTSDKCYENREWHWAYRENEAMGGYDPYSASKGCAELVTSAYRRSFGTSSETKIASARAGNVIGGSDWSVDRLVPDIARSILADEPVILRCPQAVRPWQHVLEAISGYLQLGAALLDGQPVDDGWNFGPQDEDAVCVGDLARTIVSFWERGSIVEEVDPNAVHEAKYLKLDSSKARAELGWSPLLTMQERLEWTVNWYRRWSESPTSYWKLIEEQIEAYDERVTTCIAKSQSSSQVHPASSEPTLRVA